MFELKKACHRTVWRLYRHIQNEARSTWKCTKTKLHFGTSLVVKELHCAQYFGTPWKCFLLLSTTKYQLQHFCVRAHVNYNINVQLHCCTTWNFLCDLLETGRNGAVGVTDLIELNATLVTAVMYCTKQFSFFQTIFVGNAVICCDLRRRHRRDTNVCGVILKRMWSLVYLTICVHTLVNYVVYGE